MFLRVFTLCLKVVFEFLSGHKDRSFFIYNLEVNDSFFFRVFSSGYLYISHVPRT
jgi:hypothetical protein